MSRADRIDGGTWAFNARYDMERVMRSDPNHRHHPDIRIARCQLKPLWALAGFRGTTNHMTASGTVAWDEDGGAHLAILTRCHMFLFSPRLLSDMPGDGEFCDSCIFGDPTYAVYTYRDADGRAVYVGCTVNVMTRMREHAKSAAWWPHVASASYETFSDVLAAHKVERATIVRERPRFNRQGMELLTEISATPALAA